MPMKNFTQCIKNDNSNKAQGMKKTVTTPRAETLEFIRQFARVYQYESKLEDRLCGYILN
jgi:hypothetical protein